MFEKAYTDFRELARADGSWANVEAEWHALCEQDGDDLDDYAVTSIPVLRDQAAAPHARVKVFGIFDENESCRAICFVNHTAIPGVSGLVLRVRHLILSPAYDREGVTREQYAQVLTSVFLSIMGKAFGEMPAAQVRFHLRSPADVAFFTAVQQAFSALPFFSSVQVKGSWLYVVLNATSKAEEEGSDA